MRNSKFYISILLVLFVLFSCSKNSQDSTATVSTSTEESNLATPEWAKNVNIYEVNIRQYTPEGTFTAFSQHLPRLKKMGVDILWFMPIYPISTTKSKGSLGSYYAVSSFTDINPEFGTLEEFKDLVETIHGMGMMVVLDWVPNHTGWDHHWIKEHPEYYTQDENGNIIDPINPETGESWGWTDVADLNYDNQEMRQAMINDMIFWLNEAHIDGFRCDVAHGVPDDFWEQLMPELRKINPEIFMLAEAEVPSQRNLDLFAMSYGWSFHHLLNELAQGKKNVDDLKEWLNSDRERFQKGYAMNFITNHDENSWNGTVQERMGQNADAAAVLAFTFDGMPLIYSGQEAGLDKRLRFFDKDTIDWQDVPKQDFYSRLLKLKHNNPAIWNGKAGGEPYIIDTGTNKMLIAYYREKEGHRIITILNFNSEPASFTFPDMNLAGDYNNVFSGEDVTIESGYTTELSPGGYLLLER